MAPRSSNRSGSGPIYSSNRLIISGMLRLAIQFLISLFLLPLDTLVLLSTALLHRFHFLCSPEQHNRKRLIRDTHFYPKTILITGVSTVRGLKLARQFYYGGHRVIGADVGLLPVRPGGSMSNTIFAYYSLSKTQYVCSLLDIINREKVDLWIPFSDQVTPAEDGMAKSMIESRTACRCLHVNIDHVTLFNQNDSFLQHVSEKGLPAAEKQNVQSRDSLHRILNQSPNKAYLIYNASKGTVRDAVPLPKSTRNQTYSDVSALAISKDSPWVLQQRARLGKYWADLVLVRGHIKAIKIRPVRSQASEKGDSRIENGLYEAMRRLMDRFARVGGHRMSGHLSIKLMVDEEIASDSVRYSTYMCGCRQGSSAVSALLDDPPPDLYSLYLEILSPEINGVISSPPDESEQTKKRWNYAAASTQLRITLWMGEITPRLSGYIERFEHSISPFVLLAQRLHSVALLDYTRFSMLDPLPWWWHYHISQPLNTLLSIFHGEIDVPVKRYS